MDVGAMCLGELTLPLKEFDLLECLKLLWASVDADN